MLIETHLRPVLPFEMDVGAHLDVGTQLRFMGTIPPEADRFNIDLVGGGSDDDIAFRFGPYFGESVVTRNCRLGGEWGVQECDGPFPFVVGRTFSLVITILLDHFKVAVDDRGPFVFRHRVPLQDIKTARVEGSVIVTRIDILSPEPDPNPPIRHKVLCGGPRPHVRPID